MQTQRLIERNPRAPHHITSCTQTSKKGGEKESHTPQPPPPHPPPHTRTHTTAPARETPTGETEWTINGRYTGVTDLPLTPKGEQQVLGSGRALVGAGKLIDPARLARVYVSPRTRAQRTFELLFPAHSQADLHAAARVTTTAALAEWDYGEYEGLLTAEIRARRAAKGLDADAGRPWDIWRDGCEGGESAAEVTARLDALIAEIRALQAPCMRGGETPADVVLVAHGHLLRAFTKRWLQYPMEFPLSMMLEPGGVGVLSYQHHSVDEPAFLLGMALPVQDEKGHHKH
ncbi:phosphoglycerate mutase family protein [Diplodia corticola]|uniref:Phosphoglycerate mutase family protein n=1 Tax=Diplodia corticola TaxID=236234 RepID=A0A1J9SAZ6_9PEZI|nr:phosphoglycerate mutase family protein [Diplodia corticola]OJD36757.1 phosphoglycerate mutase family protein [Diplodia corticola]